MRASYSVRARAQSAATATSHLPSSTPLARVPAVVRSRAAAQAPRGGVRVAGFLDTLFGGAAPSKADSEEDSGPNLVPIDGESGGGLGGTSEEVFGPTALLLVGFMRNEVEQVQQLLLEMEADMVRVIPCPNAALDGTLQAALEVDEIPEYEQPKLGVRRACILSGMYAAEVFEILAAFKESGLPPVVFAAAVPRNYVDGTVEELVDEIYEDHNHAQQQARAARQAAASST